jgi:hypothetical protein
MKAVTENPTRKTAAGKILHPNSAKQNPETIKTVPTK